MLLFRKSVHETLINQLHQKKSMSHTVCTGAQNIQHIHNINYQQHPTTPKTNDISACWHTQWQTLFLLGRFYHGRDAEYSLVPNPIIIQQHSITMKSSELIYVHLTEALQKILPFLFVQELSLSITLSKITNISTQNTSIYEITVTVGICCPKTYTGKFTEYIYGNRGVKDSINILTLQRVSTSCSESYTV